jgi:hypothetical protein
MYTLASWCCRRGLDAVPVIAKKSALVELLIGLEEARRTYPKSTTGRQLELVLLVGAALAVRADARTKLPKKSRCIVERQMRKKIVAVH